jgi:putative ABC transport system permease protein
MRMNVSNFGQDLRHTVRVLRKSPGYVIVAVLAIGFGVAVNSTVFTLLNAVALRGLPVHDSGDVVSVYQTVRGWRQRNVHGDSTYFSYPEYLSYRDQSSSFSGLAAYAQAELTLGGSEARVLSGDLVTCNYFDVLVGSMRSGRSFRQDECVTPGGNPVVVVSARLWRRQFREDPDILGKTLLLNGVPFVIVGVAPDGFNGASLISADLWAPISMQEQWVPNRKFLDDANLSWLQLIGRLKTDVPLKQARADLAVIAGRIDEQNPPRATQLSIDRATLMNIPQAHTIILGAGTVVLGAVTLVLLIACANLANLLLARAAGRQKEISVRLALGARRGRIVAQLLTESIILSIAGGTIGLVGAWAMLRASLPVMLSQLPHEAQSIALNTNPDIRIIGYLLALSIATGIGFGLVPALQATRVDLNAALKETGTSLGGSRRRWLRSTLVAIQVAVCLVLLIAAGLLARGLRAAQDIEPGFDMKNVTVATFDLSRQGYDAGRSAAFHRGLTERLAARGLEAALVDPVPLSGSRNGTQVILEGTDRRNSIYNATVSANYFQFLNIPVIRGRSFDERDENSHSHVAVLSESTVRRFWPGNDSLGQHFRIPGDPLLWEVIGVAADVHSMGLTDADETLVYFPLTENDYPRVSLVARGIDAGSASQAIREESRALDANVFAATGALEDNVKVWQYPARITALLGSTLGIAGLLLASMGIYGVVAYTVTQRTKEIGIRISLGATNADVVRMILAQTFRPVLAGGCVGLVSSLAVSQILKSLLFGVSPLDPIVFGGISLFLVAVALVASYVPAQRAAVVDPMIALRHE